MAIDTITVTPSGSGWLYSGNVALVSGTARLSTNEIYRIDDDPAADVDLGALTDGDPIPGWVVLNGTMTKQTDGTTPVITTDGTYGGCAYSGSSGAPLTFENVLVEAVTTSHTQRSNIVSRWKFGVGGGYLIQWYTPTALFSSISHLNFLMSAAALDRNNNSQRPYRTDTYGAGYEGKRYGLQTYSDGELESGSNRIYTFLDDEIQGRRWETSRKYGPDSVGIQSYLTSNKSSFTVYSGTEGTAEVLSLTPDTVTSWERISVGLSDESLRQPSMVSGNAYSNFLEYKIDGGSPSTFSPVPNNGIISCDSGTSINIKASLNNYGYMKKSVSLDSVSVQISGSWYPAAAGGGEKNHASFI